MTYNEAETCYCLIDPILREKGYDDHQRLKLETPAPVEPTGPKGRRRNVINGSPFDSERPSIVCPERKRAHWLRKCLAMAIRDGIFEKCLD